MVANDRHARTAFLVLLVGAACIALAPIFVRLSEIGPVPTAFWRTALAVPFLAAMVPLLPDEPDRKAGLPGWGALGGFALAGALFAGDLGFWHWSIVYTSVANATLFANMAPVFVALFAFLLYGTRFTRLFLAGMAVALAGAAMLMGDSAALGGRHLLGDALGLVTAMFYAGYFLAIARLRARYSAGVVIALSTPFTALCLVPPTLISGAGWFPETVAGWAVLAGVAVVSQSLGQGLIAYAFAHLPPAFGAVSLLLQPVLAACFAWLLFDEAVAGLQALGMVAVLTGVVMARQGALVRP
ncbi:DMT family transporter [Ectothiorhodospiraceae bacterium WFHF3C12]|nr:DMT family transporter [Ectothiorhodospiraceae bacterium WFHF3C12]